MLLMKDNVTRFPNFHFLKISIFGLNIFYFKREKGLSTAKLRLKPSPIQKYNIYNGTFTHTDIHDEHNEH